MRIMAIDYGDAHTGIAISDPTGFLTGTTTTIHSRKAEEVAGDRPAGPGARCGGAGDGVSRNMDGTEGPGRSCTGTSQPWWRTPRGSGPCSGTNGGPPWTPTVSCLRREKRQKAKKTVDAVAASLILEGYLDHRRLRG